MGTLRLPVLLGAIGLFACPPPSPADDCAQNCSGCCTDSAQCMDGTAPSACGTSGALCAACDVGAACVQGACGTASTPDDPCQGVTSGGKCLDAQTVQLCSTPTGNGMPTLVTYSCGTGTQCVASGAGFQAAATCQPTGMCVPGTTQCAGSTQLQTCTTGGTWSTGSCPFGCGSVGTGAFCRPQASGTLTAQLQYEARAPNATHPTDWATTTFIADAPGFLAVSFTACDTGNCQLIDAQVTDNQGNFTLQTRGALDAGDYLAFLAVAFGADGGLAYVVADPGLYDGGAPLTNVATTVAKPNPRVWGWFAPTPAVAPGSAVTIHEANGSGAARVFDYMRFTYGHSASIYSGHTGLALVAWLGLGTSWQCGSCMQALPTTAFDFPFQSQIWFNGSETDQAYWSDAVTAHELGHWVMSSYSFPPIEGGPHCLGIPDPPGQAWSEGWATWHSSDVRNDPVYYDKQQGSMFYVDLSSRSYSAGEPAWSRPSPTGGLLQMLDENEVSSMLWSMSTSATNADLNLYAALASPRMTTRMFNAWEGTQSNLRGYTWHTWAQACPVTLWTDQLRAIPALPDFLDALACGGLSPSTLDAATSPATNYPYSSASPLCQ